MWERPLFQDDTLWMLCLLDSRWRGALSTLKSLMCQRYVLTTSIMEMLGSQLASMVSFLHSQAERNKHISVSRIISIQICMHLPSDVSIWTCFNSHKHAHTPHTHLEHGRNFTKFGNYFFPPVDTSHAGKCEQTVRVVSPSGRNLPVDIKEGKNFTYNVSYVPTESGQHRVYLLYNNIEFPGKRFSLIFTATVTTQLV